MNRTIEILPEDLVNKIAAGEIIERPASVVKELIENSIDAKSTKIRIQIYGGGRGRIRVTDNGIGMSREDAILSVQRHATSKLKDERELFFIRTMGFRGEALPSIAAVSKFRVVTSDNDSGLGTSVEVEGGEISLVSECASPRGTDVEVSNLFYNTPVRAKFMKTKSTEMGHIYNLVMKYGISYTHIHFQLINEKRTVIDVLPSKDLYERVSAMFDRNITGNLIPVSHETETMSVKGFISKPSVTRTSRDYQFLFVNSRPVRDRTVFSAIGEGLKTLYPPGRHPVIFLFLQVADGFVDVNIHPTKTEVKFARQHEVFALIRDGLRNSAMSSWASGALAAWEPVERPIYEKKEGKPSSFNVVTGEERYKKDNELPVADSSEKRWPAIFDDTGVYETGVLDNIRPVGQIQNTFLMLEGDKGIIILDQHTVHERVLFERLMNQVNESRIDSQRLLFSPEIKLTMRESDAIEKGKQLIHSLGFAYEREQKDVVKLTAIPSVFSDKDYITVFIDLIDEILLAEDGSGGKDVFYEALSLMACRGAVKAGDPLEKEMIQSLVEGLKGIENPTCCPHGRPTLMVIPYDEIKKRFFRH